MPTFARREDGVAVANALKHLETHMPGPGGGTYRKQFYPVVCAMKQLGYTEAEVAAWATAVRGQAEYTWKGLGEKSRNPVAVIVAIANRNGYKPANDSRRAYHLACAGACGKFMINRCYDWQGLCSACAGRRRRIDAAIDDARNLAAAERWEDCLDLLESLAPETDEQKSRVAAGIRKMKQAMEEPNG